MQMVETMKTRSQESFANVVQKVQAQPDGVKTWAATAGGAVVGALAVTAAASGIVALFATLAAPPVALTVGAVGGGLLGWNYIRQQQSANQPETAVEATPVATLSVAETAVAPDEVAMTDAVAMPVVAEAVVTPVMPLAAVVESEPASVTLAADPAPMSAETDKLAADEAAIAPATVTSDETPEVTAEVIMPAPADDLAAITGIGPVYAGRLRAAGIQTFAQLAELTPEQVREIMGPVRSGHLIEAERWIAEARQFSATNG